MYIGVSFELPHYTKSSLYQILKCIDVKSYAWYNSLSQCDVFDEELNLFAKDVYSGNEMHYMIMQKADIIFLKLQAYQCDDEFTDCNSYEEFISSKCKILLLIYDNIYVDIYVKEKEAFEKLLTNANASGFKNIKKISVDNDCRKVFNVIND